MAGKTVPTAYAWKLIQGDLKIYLASTKRGALRVALSMDRDMNSCEYFQAQLPGTRISESDHHNRLLIAAVASALSPDPPGSLPPLDVHFTSFQWQVLKAAAAIPFGETRTYGQLAEQVGKPGAARAVGQVMHRNPLPLIFP